MSLLSICFSTIIIFYFCAPPDARGDDGVSERFAALAIRGELPQAMELLSSESASGPSAAAQPLFEQSRGRFVDRDEMLSPNTGDEFIDGLVAAYRNYWRRTMMRELSLPDGALALDAELQTLLGRQPAISPRNRPSLDERIRAAGYHYYDEPAPPFRELLLWKQQEPRSYRVVLTDLTLTVQVILLDGFVSQGWKDYASLGLARTSGWVEHGTLYCVSSAYPRGSEYFAVSFLKHESRHLADHERFPGLPSAELEYRAKLTELAFASTTLRRLLEDFTSKGERNSGSPHAEANYRVVRDLYLEIYGRPVPAEGASWVAIEADLLNRSARSLLERNTAALQAAPVTDTTDITNGS